MTARERTLTAHDIQQLFKERRKVMQVEAVFLLVTLAFWLSGGHTSPILFLVAILCLITAFSVVRNLRRCGKRIRGIEEVLERNEVSVFPSHIERSCRVSGVQRPGTHVGLPTGHNMIVFVAGQQFYASARFPNTDFSQTMCPGSSIDGRIQLHGEKLVASRVIPVAMWWNRLRYVDHLEATEGRLEDLEKILAK